MYIVREGSLLSNIQRISLVRYFNVLQEIKGLSRSDTLIEYFIRK